MAFRRTHGDDPNKLLFLDIDGVLNNLPYYHSAPYKRDCILNHHSARQYDLKKLDLLKQIHDKTKCTIVMSSSWRAFYFKENWKSRMGDGCMRLKKDLKKRKIVIRYRTGDEYDEKLYAYYSGLKWVEDENGKCHTEYVEPEDRVYPKIEEFYERGLQIKNFLDKWEKRYGKCTYAILDDDRGDLILHNEHFVNTKWGYKNDNPDECGLTQTHVDKCIELLGGYNGRKGIAQGSKKVN